MIMLPNTAKRVNKVYELPFGHFTKEGKNNSIPSGNCHVITRMLEDKTWI